MRAERQREIEMKHTKGHAPHYTHFPVSDDKLLKTIVRSFYMKKDAFLYSKKNLNFTTQRSLN